MNNGDMPASPSGVVSSSDGCIYEALDAMPKDTWGLTKREAFAMAAMQGMLSNSNQKFSRDIAGYDGKISRSAVMQADALLKALEEK